MRLSLSFIAIRSKFDYMKKVFNLLTKPRLILIRSFRGFNTHKALFMYTTQHSHSQGQQSEYSQN